MIHPLVLEALKENIHLVVPRLRLVRQLHIAYGDEINRPTWQAPQIFVFNQWINKQLEQALREEGMMICTDMRINILWEEALDSLPERVKTEIGWDIFAGDEESVKRGFVRQAQSAWRLIHQYHLSWENKDYREFPMSRFFHRWGCVYQELCYAKKIIDPTIAVVEFNRRVYEGSVVPARSLWAGWNEDISPLYRKSWQLAQKVSPNKQDISVNIPIYAQKEAQTHSCRCYSDEDQELKNLVVQVRKWSNDHPEDSIGVVIPGLENMWHRVRRLFGRTFHTTESMEETGESLPFDISWGEQVRFHPLIGDLLRLLAITKGPQPVGDFVDMFLSPYIRAAADEQIERYRLKEQIAGLSQYHTHLSLCQLLQILKGKKDAAQAPQLFQALSDFYAVEGAFIPSASPHHWAEVFSHQAKVLGWVVVSDRSHEEFYLSDRWEEMLDSLYSLARVVPLCSRERALAFLTDEAQKIYQTFRHDCNIRILAPSEAEGLLFDKLFLCGMNENAIARPSANFFIPYRLGQAAALPGYTIEGDWEKEKRTVHRLLQASSQLEISYASKTNEEDQLLHPALRFLTPEIQERPSFRPSQLLALTEIKDWTAPAVGDDESLRSIVTLVKYQAECPFKAFARFRLNPAEPNLLNDQLSAAERGTMLHSLLKEIWAQLGDKKALLTMKDKELSQLVKEQVKRVMVDYVSQQVLLRDDLIAELEERYLVELAEELLAYERQSPNAFQIYSLEENKELKDFHGYDFSVKIDRIDSLNQDNSQLMILDYKLRKNPFSVSVLTGERPDEPQLLIYSLLLKDCKALGLVVASRKKGVTSVGLLLEDGISHPIGKWQRFSRQEFKQLQRQPGLLFENFLHGKAQVDPKSTATCNYCAYASLCRISVSH